jgi:hypothetical protein
VLPVDFERTTLTRAKVGGGVLLGPDPVKIVGCGVGRQLGGEKLAA